MERFEPRGDGSMLEEVGGKNGGGSSGQVQCRGQQKRGSQRQRLPAGMEACTKKQKIQDTNVRRRLLGKNLRFVQRRQSTHEEFMEEEVRRQQKMKVLKEMTRKGRSKGRELLAADCKKVWLRNDAKMI